jgi:Gas vesicle protein
VSGASLDAPRLARSPRGAREVTLLDLLDRLLSGGVVIQGEITLAAADIDLVNLGLRVVVGSVEALRCDLASPVQARLD